MCSFRKGEGRALRGTQHREGPKTASRLDVPLHANPIVTPALVDTERAARSRRPRVIRSLQAALALVVFGIAADVIGQVPPATTENVVVWAKEGLAVTTQSTLTAGRETRLVSGQMVVNDPGGLLIMKGKFRAL